MSLPVWEVTWYFSIPSWTSHKPSEDVPVNVWHALKTQEGNHLRLKSWDELVPVPVSHTASCLLSGTKKPQKITRTHRNSILISVTSRLMALLILQWSPTPMKFHVSSSSTHPSVHPSVHLSVQAPGSHFPWDGVGGSCSDADSFWCGGAAVLQALYGWDSGGSSHRPPVSSLSCFGVCPQLTVTDEGRKLRKHTSTSPTSLQTLHSPLIYEQDPKIFAGVETPLFSTLSTMTLWSFVCRKKSNKAHIGVDVKPDFTGWDLWGATAVVFMGV